MPSGATGNATANPFKVGLFPLHYLTAFILVTTLFFLWGFAYGLLDVLNKHFQNVLNITKLKSTGLQVAYFGFGYFCFSPVAGEVMKRKGYKFTIIMGLSLYALGAIMFWPCAKFSMSSSNKDAVFGGFVVCTGVIASGLASLEVAANSYISVMPPVSVSSFRLQLSQAFNGVAQFAGPFIAAKYFFRGENANNLTNVQWVYLAVAIVGVIVALLFLFTKLPEVEEADLVADDTQERRPLWKETRAVTGFITQFFYVAAQVTIGALFLNYTHDAGFEDHRGSELLSYALILFTVGRFFGVVLLAVVTAPVLLGIYALIAAVVGILISTLHGTAGVAMVMLIMFFESIMFPIIFALATKNLGYNTRRGSSLVIMGIVGGAVYPPCQAAIADRWNTRVSFWIIVPNFLIIAAWSVYIWHIDGRHFTTSSEAKAVRDDNESGRGAEEGFEDVKAGAEVEHREKY
ncbi:Glucose/galactose transporter [Vanrija pseudolonga]|uniref:Glucose/galactose transporter n=1 Tax=Vanrija pseudolonga TaxID=143232 RepID=A0AAF1BN95_9TREE|nr:Glucose/galactose transporter [Vanrija pseudolonga]